MARMGLDQKKFSIFLIVLILLLVISSALFAQEEKGKKDSRPERGIAVYTEYSNVAIPKGEAVKMNLILENKGRADETINVKLSESAKGWKATLRSDVYQVSGMFVPGGKSRSLALSLEPDDTVGIGTYEFKFDAQTADGNFTSAHTLTVNVQKKTVTKGEDIQITSSYPVLKGPTDTKFEFNLEVLNKSLSERTLNLLATGPEKWDIFFRPAYETKHISSLLIKGGQSQTVAVEAKPPEDAVAGEYPVLIRVSSGDQKAEVKLTVLLTGTYKIDAGTPTGNLSLEALAGKPANLSIFVKNIGSAVNRNITFSSFKPENWEVTFKPDKIDALEPGAIKQVEITIKPAQQALVGDYSVGLWADGEKSNKNIEMRVTVKASTAWGWIGIGIILFVIAGLSILFIRLGRR